jgi:N-acetylglucosamine kinase-like BadF-type ATPase
MQEMFFIGIDGGGHKTAGALFDGAGRRRGAARLGGSAIVGRPAEPACAILDALVADLCRQAGVGRERVRRCGLGLSGIDFADEHALQLEVIARAIGIPAGRVLLVNDGIPALWGATAAPAAAILQHGSSFTTAWRPEFGREKIFDSLDAGAIFDLRKAALHLVARMIDGRRPAAPFKDRLLRHFGVADEKSFAELAYRDRLPRAAGLTVADMIFQAWQDGDATAAELVGRALDDYAVTVSTMLALTGQPAPDAILGGGVLRGAPERFWDELRALIRRSFPGSAVKPPDLPPEHGAAIMAAHAEGLGAPTYFRAVQRAGRPDDAE